MRAKPRKRQSYSGTRTSRKRRGRTPRSPSTANQKERRRRRDAERLVRELRKEAAARKRTARELVDRVLQGLYAVGLGLETSRTLLAVSPQRASQALTRATDQLNDLIHHLRAYLASRSG